MNAIEQATLIWPKHNWYHHVDKLRWVTDEIPAGRSPFQTASGASWPVKKSPTFCAVVR
jgi:hypothetical protein